MKKQTKVAKEEILSPDVTVAPVASTPLAVMPGPVSIMQIIDKNVLTLDTDKLGKLMDLYERGMENQRKEREYEERQVAKKAFDRDFVQMQPELPTVVRTKTNDQTKKKYAALEDINEAINKTLKKYNFGISSKVIKQSDADVTVAVYLRHAEGYVEENVLTMPLDNKGPNGTINKTGPHALASSIMYVRRVAECVLLNISTGDDKDGNSDTPAEEKKKSNNEFDNAIQQETSGKPGVSDADYTEVKDDSQGEAVWDGKKIFVALNKPPILGKWKGPTDAGNRLIQAMVMLKKNADRSALMLSNLSLLHAIEKLKPEMVSEIHALTQKGE